MPSRRILTGLKYGIILSVALWAIIVVSIILFS